MTRRATLVASAGLLVFLIGGIAFNAKFHLMWRRHGAYPVDNQRALAKSGDNMFLINRAERVTYRLSHLGWLLGPIGIWPRGDIKGVVLEDRVKLEDDRYGSKFNDHAVAVSFPGPGNTTATIVLPTDW